MFTSGVLDVVIGLAFIFLLYSLLATTVQEAYAGFFQQRATMLRQGIRQMLTNTDYRWTTTAAFYINRLYELARGIKNLPRDVVWFAIKTRRAWRHHHNTQAVVSNTVIQQVEESTGEDGWLEKIYKQFLAFLFAIFPEPPQPRTGLWQQFYAHPLIKNYGENRNSPLPSYIPPESFSEVLIDILKKEKAKFYAEQAVLGCTYNADGKSELKQLKDFLATAKHLPEDTVGILQLLLSEAEKTAGKKQRDANPAGAAADPVADTLPPISDDVLIEFKLALEKWFNDSMARVSGWYKKQTQIILLLIGIAMAVGFNIDSIEIANKLSKDKEARKQLADMATAYLNNNPKAGATVATTDINTSTTDQKQKDSLVAYAQNLLQTDIGNANSLLAIGYDGYGENDQGFVQAVLLKNESYNRLIKRYQLDAQRKVTRDIKVLRTYGDSIRNLGSLIENNTKSRKLVSYYDSLVNRQKLLGDSIAIFDSVASPSLINAMNRSGNSVGRIIDSLQRTTDPSVKAMLNKYLSAATPPEQRIVLDSNLRVELKKKDLSGLFDSVVFYRDNYVAQEAGKMNRHFKLNDRLLKIITGYNLVKADTSTKIPERSAARAQVYTIADSVIQVADYNKGFMPSITQKMATSKLYQGENCSLLFIKVRYVWYLCSTQMHKLIGFLLSAFAISLGAPFWFDLLNKVMQLRGSVKEGAKK